MGHGYNAEIVCMVFGIGSISNKLETELKNRYYNDAYFPKIKFGGYTECFKYVDKKDFKEYIFKNIPNGNYGVLENVFVDWCNNTNYNDFTRPKLIEISE